MSQHSRSANALIAETSPYLLQHAHNPVAWYPWGSDALELARSEDKPILLSIGYSACHWCHVMAHESFEDEATAAVMNDFFVNIKVDREERPDLDKIYQTAHQILTQRPGGWPLTMFLTPDDQTPFFGGTYFPREQRHGLPAFANLLGRIADFYRDHRDQIRRQNTSLVDLLARLSTGGDPADITPAALMSAREKLAESYDTRHAGFGGAPKFPHPTNLERLLRHWAASRRDGDGEDTRALEMARHTLHAMAAGGLFDQLGGGFFRYSVDDYWMIPHFEKMLYDNGPLLGLYSDAWLATGEPVFARVAHQTADWVIREMQSPAGGYYATLDADSEGEEGKFYVWTRDEVDAALTTSEYALLSRCYGLDRRPNFEGQHHLHTFRALPEIADEIGMAREQAISELDRARQKLYARREHRVRPGRDEKVLSAWNALMIRGMAAAGRALGEPRYIDSAVHALDFIRAQLWRDGRLLACHKDERAVLPAYLDDHAFLVAAVLELLQARWDTAHLRFAIALADLLLDHFEDRENGGFFFTADDHERLIQRPKPLMDEAIPAGNGIAAWALGRLGHLLGETRYLDAATRTLRSAWAAVGDVPHAHASLLSAAEEYLDAPQLVIVRGDADATHPWAQRCARGYAPRRMSFVIPSQASDLPGLLAERKAGDGVTAYVCSGQTCHAPIDSLTTLEEALRASEVRAT